MKKASEVFANIDMKKEFKDARVQDGSIDARTAKIIDRLFLRLCGIFPAFRQAWPSQEEYNSAKYEWTTAFVSAKLSDVNKIKFGLDKFKGLKNPFVPTPGQFIAMCNPSPGEMGMPSMHMAYKEACENSHPSVKNKEWSHPTVHHAWKECGSYNLSNWAQVQSRPLFERNYEIACRLFSNGEKLHKIDLAIEAPDKVVVINKNVGSSALSEMKHKLGLSR